MPPAAYVNFLVVMSTLRISTTSLDPVRRWAPLASPQYVAWTRVFRTRARASGERVPRALIVRAKAPSNAHLATPGITKMASNAWLVKQANTRLTTGSQAARAPKTYARAATVLRRRALIARATTPPSAGRAAPDTTWTRARVFRTRARASGVRVPRALIARKTAMRCVRRATSGTI